MSHAPIPNGHQPLAATEFRLFQELVYRETGIHLTETKRELLVARLARRLRALRLGSFGAYYRRVASDAQERRTMFDCLTTHETQFFREPSQFDFLRRDIIPAWLAAAASGHRPRAVRAWSAGCSTGEEAYSVAMTLMSHLPQWSIRVLATDLSTRVLQIAADGIWPADRAHAIPLPYRKRYMLKGCRSQEGKIKAGTEVRSALKFRRFNLNDTEGYSRLGVFDLIMCRNVLIYFDAASRRRAMEQLIGRLDPSSGYLFVGHAESLTGQSRVENVIPTGYRIRREDEAARPPACALAGATPA